MTAAIVVVLYLAVGIGCAAYRAYIDPRLLAEEGVTHRNQTLFFRGALLACVLVWPIYAPLGLLLPALASAFQERGRAALRRARELEAARIADEREVERIIRESRL